MNNFLTNLFHPQMGPITGIITQSQSGFKSNSNEGVPHTLQIKCSLVSYSGDFFMREGELPPQ